MSERGSLPADVADLLSAVLESLDLPLPSHEDGDERAHYWLLRLRASDVRVTLSALLAHPEYPDLRDDAAYIRKGTAKLPVTYTPFVSSRTEETG